MSQETERLANARGVEEGRWLEAALIGILLIALVLRVGAALLLPDSFHYRADAAEYLSSAANLLDHGVYGKEAGIPYALVPPGYPLFMAAILVVTNRSFLAVRLAQALIGTLAVWFTYLAGKRAFSTKVGLAAAVICAGYAPFVVYVVPYLTEALYVPLFAIYLALLVASFRKPSGKNAALAGLGFGLTLLTRETLVALPLALPLLFWWARFTLRQALRYGFAFVAMTLLVLTPWLARNRATFGRVFYTSRTEYIQYSLTGVGHLSPRYEQQVDREASPVTESDEKYDYYQRYGRTSDVRSVHLLVTQPWTWAGYLINRLVAFWLHPSGLWSLPELFVVRAGYIAAHAAMLGLALWQIILGLRRRDAVTGALAVVLLYVTGVGVLLSRPNPRYNLPFLPIIFIFASRGLITLIPQLTGFKRLRVRAEV